MVVGPAGLAAAAAVSALSFGSFVIWVRPIKNRLDVCEAVG
jgi:hypothetical protein